MEVVPIHQYGEGVEAALARLLKGAPSWHWDCSAPAMMDMALSIAALIAGGIALEAFAATRTLFLHDQRDLITEPDHRQTPELMQLENPS